MTPESPALVQLPKGNRVYLPFDDGPDARWTPRILDILAKAQARATFFVVGRQARGQAALVRQIAAQGHEIELMLAGVASNADVLAKFSGITVSCTPSYRDEEIPSIVSRYDIGVMPLSDGPWERAKCAMKALIYMAGGKPTVCSRVGENTYVIADASNGFLAESPGQWTKALGALMSDAALRAKIGRRGRDTVEARYSSRVCFGLLMEHVFSRAGATLGPAETVN